MRKYIKKIIIALMTIFCIITYCDITVYATQTDVSGFEAENKTIIEEIKKDAQSMVGKRDDCPTYETALQAIKNMIADSSLDESYYKPLIGNKYNNKKTRETLRKNLVDYIDSEIRKQNTQDVTAASKLTSAQTTAIYNDVQEWIRVNKDKSNYRTLLKNKTTSQDYGTYAENTYAQKLYKAEYERLTPYKMGLSQSELQKEINALEAEIKQLEAYPESYNSNGKTRNQLLAEKKELLELYKQDLEEETHPKTEEGVEIEDETTSNPDAVLGKQDATTKHNLDEILNEAANFLKKGDSSKINTDKLQDASDTVYNILLALGIVGTVLTGIYLAIKFIVSSVEEQAKVKESIIPYIVGCVVIFGAFIIWKLAIIVLRGIA